MTTTATQEVSVEEMKGIDAIIVIDHSGSMGEPSMRFKGKNKYQELQEDATAVAREFEKYDSDGLSVISFSSGVKVIDGVTAQKVADVFTENQPRGSTNLAEALTAAVEKARSSTKQAVIMVYTDGSPDDASAAMKVIEAAGKEFGRPRIGFVFIQVGNDLGAAAFLDTLDTKMTVDVCATVSAKDAESLNVQQLVWLACNK